MEIETLRALTGWLTLVNFAILLWWFFAFMLSRDWLYRTIGKWFKITPEQFDAIQYLSMMMYESGILLFNLTPYLVLRFAL